MSVSSMNQDRSDNNKREAFNIMFVCTGNTCRSPMAEAAFRKLVTDSGVDDIEVFSSGAGALDGQPASRFAVETVKLWDIDLTAHKSQALTKSLIDQSDLIFALAATHYNTVLGLAPEAYDRTYLLKKFPESGDKGEGVIDPIGMPLTVYNEVFLDITTVLELMLPRALELADKKRRSAQEGTGH